MSEKLLRMMIQSKQITIGEIQSFFKLNQKQTIELLIQFLDKSIEQFDSKNPENNKYLFYTMDMIQTLYESYEEEYTTLPFLERFKVLKQELYDLSHVCKNITDKCKSITIEEQIYLEIYYYKDMGRISKIITDKNIGKITDTWFIEDIIISYLDSLKTGEYEYYKNILSLLIESSDKNQRITLQIEQYFSNHMDAMLKDFPRENMNRLKEFRNLLNEVRKKNIQIYRKLDIGTSTSSTTTKPMIFTIDELNTHIKEDAISITKEGDYTYITVYIIDPISRVFHNQKLLTEATTQWFEYDSNHLFKPSYARKNFSLNKGKIKKVIAFEYCFDKRNIVRKLNIFEDKITVTENFTYDEISELLKHNIRGKPKIPYLNDLYDIIKVLHDNNLYKKRYHLLKQLHRCLNSEDDSYIKPEEKNGCMIISELKILTNHSIATLFRNANVPCIYRNNQFVASEEDVNMVKEECNEIGNMDQICNELQNLNIESWYSDENKGHYGLHLDCYVHATTPVRNLFSLINLRMLKDILIHKKYDLVKEYEVEIHQIIERQKAKVQRRKSGNQKRLVKNRKKEVSHD